MKPRPILYVDDEKASLAVFQAAFEDTYDVHVASCGSEALDVLAACEIHVVITDMRMPEMSGSELLARCVQEFSDPVRMILTGHSDMASVIQAINAARVYQYMTKPWDESELGAVIKDALAQYDSQARQRSISLALDEQARKEAATREVFQRYVPRQVVEQVLGQDAAAAMATTGEHRSVTLLTSDIRGFTSLSDRLTPRQVLALMNEYFSAMTEVMERNHGTVTQFLGDGLLAVFGAPIDTENNEANAVEAALDMLPALEEFNRSRARQLTGEDLVIGIGVHCGDVVVGNIGSPEKTEYAAIGAPVYQVMKLESLCKSHPNAILLSDRLRARLPAGRFLTELLKGARLETSGGEPATVWRVAGRGEN